MAATWQVGPDTYNRVVEGGVTYAVPNGNSVADGVLVFRVGTDSRSGKEYFVNTETQKRRWTLPRVPAKSSRSMRDRVIAFYEMYNPDKVGNVDVTLTMFENRHEELMASLVDKYGPEPPFYPAPTMRESNLRRLLAFYERYNPDKISSCESLLEKYSGREAQLFRDLTQKYGAEPEAPPEGGAASAAGAAGGSSGEEDRAEYELRAQALLRKHKPKMLEKLPTLMGQWQGQEEGLLQMLGERYGAEPEPGDDTSFAGAPSAEESAPVSPAAAPAAAPTYRDRVLALMQEYAPNKVDKVDGYLAKNVGNEESFIAALVSKYGPEPAPKTPGAAAQPPASQAADRALPTAEAAAASAEQRKAEEAPAAATVEPPVAVQERSIADRVHAMYAQYRPKKTHLAAAALEQYAGQEDVLLQTLVDKYGAEPPAPVGGDAAQQAASMGDPAITNDSVVGPGVLAAATDEPAQPAEVAGDDAGKAKTPTSTTSPSRPQSQPPATTGGQTPQQTVSSAPATPQPQEEAGAPAPGSPTGDEEGALVALNEHPIFSTYTSSPPSVKQQLLLNFLNDRESRLRDALSHNQKTQTAIADLKTANAHLTDEKDTVARRAEVAAAQMEHEAMRAKEHAEDSTRLWRLEKEQLVAQQRVAEVAAQRALNEAKLQFEEERTRKAHELHELRRRAATADEDARSVTEQSSRLLQTLEARQIECANLKVQLERLKTDAVRDLADKEVQTDRPVVASASVHPHHHHDASSLHASPIHGADATASAVGAEAGKEYKCARCPKRAGYSCRTCRLRLCGRCDEVIHRSNSRFRVHERKSLATGAVVQDVSVSRSGSRAQASTQRSASRTTVEGGTPPAPVDLSVDEIEAQFDSVLAEHENSRHAMQQYQDVVAQLEDRIRDLRDECEQLRETGTAPSVAADIAAREADQAAAEREAIQELTAINRSLTERVADLELQLLAQPGPAPADDSDVAALQDEVQELKGQLRSAKSSVREYRDEIRLLRGRLQLQMAQPYGARGI